MQIIIFHRSHTKNKNKNELFVKDKSENLSPEQLPPGVEVAREEDNAEASASKRGGTVIDGLSQFDYQLKETSSGVLLSVQAVFNGITPVKRNIVIQLQPWSMLTLYYYPPTGQVEIVDLSVLNSGPGNMYKRVGNYVASIVVTDADALIYLRGRLKNIPGFKNIVVPDNQDSSMAFANYSSKAKKFIEDEAERRTSLGKVDVYRQLAYMEAQLDVLTKIILENNLIKDKELRMLLEDSQKWSACGDISKENLKKRIEYKKLVRGAYKHC